MCAVRYVAGLPFIFLELWQPHPLRYVFHNVLLRYYIDHTLRLAAGSGFGVNYYAVLSIV